MFSEQTFLAQKSLSVQLQRIGFLASTECISMFAEEYGKFRRCTEFIMLLLIYFLLSQDLPVNYVFSFIINHFSLTLVWAEQGDEISLGYAGTHALKGDLVR